MKHTIYIFIILLVTACGEELMSYDVSTDAPIVESYLQEGADALTVKLYSMEVFLKDDYVLSKPISGLQLNVNDKILTETSSGVYSLNLENDTIRGLQNYDLSFEYRGKKIAATTSVPQPITGLSIEPAYITRTSYFGDESNSIEIKLKWDDPDRNYYQIYIESPASSDMPLPDGTSFRRRMMQPFQGNSYTAISREFRSAGYYWIYVYRVNKEYADLYERISSTDLANPSSTIQNAFGIFTAMSVTRIGFRVYETE